MAKVLLGWELGANRGHVQPLVELGSALEARGDTVIYAVQQVDALVGVVPRSSIVLQAPLWPRLLKTVTQPPAPTTATMGDILARIGLTQPGTLSSMVSGWDALMSLVKPDLVIGDFAPALACAARGRVPMIGIGSSFCQPPASMSEFPNFFGDAVSGDQTEMLSVVNEELAIAGCLEIGTLPHVFSADKFIVNGFAELDAYAPWRPEPLFSPPVEIPHDFELLSMTERNEIFVYYYQAAGEVSSLWEALEMSRLPVRVYVPRLDRADVLALEKRGFVVERAPVAWSDIARRSRILLSHGGTGFVSNALALGLPQIIAYYDVEKLLTARAVGELGLGLHVNSAQINPAILSAAIIELYHDDVCAKRSSDRAPQFVAQLDNSALAGSIMARDELLGQV